MKLWINQNKYVISKPKEFVILKGKIGTGKSEAMLHRMLNIKNNFSFEEGDRILFIVKDRKDLKNIKSRYKIAEENNEYMYMSLLSSKFEPEFYTFNDFMKEYSKDCEIISTRTKIKFLKEILRKNNFNNKRKFCEDNIFKIIEEIRFIKNSTINTPEDFPKILEDPLRIKKNQKDLQDMFLIIKEYNKLIKKQNLFDDEDFIYNLSKTLNKANKKYVHIFIDNAESLTNLEMELLLSIHLRKTYGTFNICVNLDGNENVYSSLVRKGRVNAKKIFGKNKKIFTFKNQVISQNEEKNLQYDSTECKFKFIDLKHRKDFDFVVEYKEDCEKIKDDYNKYNSDELEEIPVYENIAAGEPILINEEQQDAFVLPKFWVKSSNNKFILRVKGNSMINAGINDGDLVVIEQNPAPFNGDIVAVNIEGSATLKRLQLKDDKIFLMPENELYKPIIIDSNDEFYILGKAIGIISKRDM